MRSDASPGRTAEIVPAYGFGSNGRFVRGHRAFCPACVFLSNAVGYNNATDRARLHRCAEEERGAPELPYPELAGVDADLMSGPIAANRRALEDAG